MNKYILAVCQMDSKDNKEENLRTAGELIDEAAGRGASVVALPETMNFMGKGYRHQAEPVPGPTTDYLCAKARERGIWLVSGSFPEAEGGDKPKNTLVLMDPAGRIHCKYSKLHMFDVQVDHAPPSKESEHNTAGDEIVLADTPLGRWGFSVCYDLRFGEMYRLMALAGAEVIFVPASFTMHTGKDHWEVLLRARAIENGVYIAAPDQMGQKTNMLAYGKSMIIDPWGDVIARSGDRTGCVLAEIDRDYLKKVRMQIPSLKNRREDMYEIRSSCIRIY